MSKSKNIIAFCILMSALALLAGGCGGSGGGTVSIPTDTNAVWSTVKDAYIFSFPLIIMDATKKAGTNTVKPTDKKAPVNQFLHAKTLATAKFREVVTPNVDTVYSQLFIDLSQDAVVIHKPASERFLALEVMNAWSDCVTVLGTGGDTDAERTYILTGPDFNGSIPDGMTQVKMSTSMGWILGRTVCFGEDDLPNVYALQEKLTAKTLTAYLTNSDMPDGVHNEEYDSLVPVTYSLSLGAKEFFDRVNELLETNPGYPEDEEMLAKISSIGVGKGLKFDETILGENSSAKWESMKETVRAELRESVKKYMVKNGAFQNYGEPIARFGTAYDYRTMIAIAAFGANPVDVAIYPRAETDDEGNTLTGKNSYVLHFEKDALPPVKEKGFWSITVYGDDNFLIDNELNRYCINDRSEVTFNADGTLDIYLQAARPENDARVSNWLPTGSEGFHLYMRIYLPEESAINGTWKAPTITKK